MSGKVVAAGFYGRTPNASMPFYGQDANPNKSTSGQRLNVHVQEGLLDQADIGANIPWTWSKAHMLVGDKDDTRKYTPKRDPLQMEDQIPVMKGWDHLATGYAMAKLEQDMTDLTMPDGPTKLAMLNAYARELIKGKRKTYEADFHSEFAHRFREWLRGNGSNDEYREAGMMSYVDGSGKKRNTNRPISDHPSVINYLGRWQSRVIEFDKQRTLMKLRLGRQGPYGEAASIDDLWKYYKFVVYGVDATDVETLIQDAAIDTAQAAAPAVIAPSGPVPVVQPPANSGPLIVPAVPPQDSIQAVVQQVDLDTTEQEQLLAQREAARQAEAQRKAAEDEAARQAEIQRKAAEDEATRRATEELRRQAELLRKEAEDRAEQQRQRDEAARKAAEDSLNAALAKERVAREQAEKAAADAAEQLRIANQQLAGNQANTGQLQEQGQKLINDLAEQLRIANEQLAGNQQNAANAAQEAMLKAKADQEARDRLIEANHNKILQEQLAAKDAQLAQALAAIQFLKPPEPQIQHSVPMPPNQLPHGMDVVTPQQAEQFAEENRRRHAAEAEQAAAIEADRIAALQLYANDLSKKGQRRGRSPTVVGDERPSKSRSSSVIRHSPPPAPAPAVNPTPAPAAQGHVGQEVLSNVSLHRNTVQRHHVGGFKAGEHTYYSALEIDDGNSKDNGPAALDGFPYLSDVPLNADQKKEHDEAAAYALGYYKGGYKSKGKARAAMINSAEGKRNPQKAVLASRYLTALYENPNFGK